MRFLKTKQHEDDKNMYTVTINLGGGEDYVEEEMGWAQCIELCRQFEQFYISLHQDFVGGWSKNPPSFMESLERARKKE